MAIGDFDTPRQTGVANQSPQYSGVALARKDDDDCSDEWAYRLEFVVLALMAAVGLLGLLVEAVRSLEP